MRFALVYTLAVLFCFGCGETDGAADQAMGGGLAMSDRDSSRPVIVPTDGGMLAVEQDSGIGFIDTESDDDAALTPPPNGEGGNDGALPGDPADGGASMDGAPVVSPDQGNEPPGMQADFVFDPASEGLVAQFEFNGVATDISGAGRNGMLLGGDFVDTEFGQGLRVGNENHGLDWSPHSVFLTHPYSVEIVMTPDMESSSFSKLLGYDDGDEGGWYLYSEGFRTYPI
jgi:hypothetical protein